MDFPPYSLPIMTLYACVIESRDGLVFNWRLITCTKRIGIVIRNSNARSDSEVYSLARSYELSLPDCDVQWIDILKSSILEGLMILEESGFEKPVGISYLPRCGRCTTRGSRSSVRVGLVSLRTFHIAVPARPQVSIES
jgi:hypothetical protein